MRRVAIVSRNRIGCDDFLRLRRRSGRKLLLGRRSRRLFGGRAKRLFGRRSECLLGGRHKLAEDRNGAVLGGRNRPLLDKQGRRISRQKTQVPAAIGVHAGRPDITGATAQAIDRQAKLCRPLQIAEMIDQTLGRTLDLFGLDSGTVNRWGEPARPPQGGER